MMYHPPPNTPSNSLMKEVGSGSTISPNFDFSEWMITSCCGNFGGHEHIGMMMSKDY